MLVFFLPLTLAGALQPSEASVALGSNLVLIFRFGFSLA